MPFKVVVKPNQLRQNRSKKRSDKINFGLFYRFFKVITKNEMLFQWPQVSKLFFFMGYSNIYESVETLSIVDLP